MKPFGVRLAAGAVTILLGAIMAAQAQKDHQDEQNSSWNPIENVQGNSSAETPAPIGLAQWADAAFGASDQPSNDSPSKERSPFSDVPGAVQLVQHTDNAAADVANNVANNVASALALPPTLDMMPSAEGSEAAPGPKMSFPGDAPTFAGDAPGGMQMPSTPDSGANDGGPQDFVLPGGDDHADQPSNFLRGSESDSIANDAAAATEQQAERGMAVPNNFMGSFAGDAPAQPEAGNVAGGFGGQATPMLRAMMPDDPGPSQIEQQQALAAEQQMRDEMAREQQARDEMDRQRQADDLLAQERLAREREIREQELMREEARQQQALAQQRPAAPTMNQFAADNRFSQLPPQNERRGMVMRGQEQPLAPALPQTQYDNGFQDLANGRRDLAPRDNGYGRGLAALPAAHKLAGQRTGVDAQPGDRRLEGAQAPSVVIHKRAPSEVKVGKPASFVIHVQNVGSAEALGVMVHDQIPAGMQFKSATPEPQGGPNGQLVWQLGALAAGEERTLTMELIPVEEGELGSVARVTFEAAASVRTMSTRPEIKIVQKAPATVLIGQQLEIEVEVSNPGTGDATGVMLQEDVPENLEHPQGRELDNLIGTLRPGEVRRQMLRLRAVAPGMIRNTIFLRADDGLETSHSVDVQVVAPNLQVALVGPGRRFLERQAVYNLDIGNNGTAPATNVRITAFLDRGFTFVSTGKAGQYDPSRHAVYWSLDDLPVGAQGQVPLTLLPVQEGSRAIQLEAKADLGIIAKNEHQVAVESLAELTFSVADTADPIEVGTETVYEIKVANNGSRADSNVRVQVQLPAGIELIDAEDAETNGRGLVVFRPRAQLAANAELVYRIKTRGVQDGRHKIEAVVISDQSTVPVTKEESTMVYDDRQPAIARQNRLPGQQLR
ncbi:MAG: hypothetical protein WBD20_14700 [Pirellulaceae bacterium]